jgi:drug/metabolite transporter (DMT)-like permease
MGIAFIPVLLWALGSLYTARATRYFGPMATNRIRLLIASVVLGLWVTLGPGLPRHGALWGWLLLSGVLGLGLGDLAMLSGYRILGARRMVLIVLCVAVPVSGLSEWIWLGTRLTLPAVALMFVLLAGVVVAVLPGGHSPAHSRGERVRGIGFGLLAALGQGLGASLSRVAYHAAEADGIAPDGTAAALQRMLGGLACTLAAERILHLSPGESPMERAAEAMGRGDAPRLPRAKAIRAMVLAAALGPILGLSAYQRALVELPSALTQAICALTPVAVIPLARWMEGDRAGWRGIVGGVLACAAAAALSWIR